VNQPGSPRFNPGQKSNRVEICKKISTQPDPNTWWAGLTRRFQPILTSLHKVRQNGENHLSNYKLQNKNLIHQSEQSHV